MGNNNRTLRVVLLVLGLPPLSGLTACIDLGLGVSPVVSSVTQTVAAEGTALPEFARVVGMVGSLSVTGQIVGRLECDEVRGTLEEKGDNLNIAMVVVSGRQACNSLTPTTLLYVASVYGLDPGPTEVAVWHGYMGVSGTPGERAKVVVTVR